MLRNKTALVTLCMMMLALASCSSDKKPPLKGDRVSVLELQNTLEIDKAAAAAPIDLPPVKNNTSWPQAGGNASHTPGPLALGANLKPIWSANIGKGSADDRKLVTTPIIADNRVFAADTKGNVSALDLNSGKKIWAVDILPKGEDTIISGGLSFGDGVLYAIDGVGDIFALNAQSGATLWKQKLAHPARGSPTYQSGRLYIITLSDETLALDAKTGNTIWTHKGIEEAAGLLGAPSPAVADSVVITLYSSGDVVALRAETGQEAWSDNLTGALEANAHAVTQLAGFRGHPVLDGDELIVGNNAARTVAIHVPSGERTWQKEFGAMQMPYLAGNIVYILTPENSLVALLKDTGQVRWITQLDRYEDPDKRSKPIFWSGPVLAGGRLIVVSSNKQMLDINPQSGAIAQRSIIPGSAMLSPVVAQNTLLLLLDNGTLVAYR